MLSRSFTHGNKSLCVGHPDDPPQLQTSLRLTYDNVESSKGYFSLFNEKDWKENPFPTTERIYIFNHCASNVVKYTLNMQLLKNRNYFEFVRWITIINSNIEGLPNKNLIKMDHLYGIDLRGNKIGDIDSISPFICINNCPKLIYLDLRDNPISYTKNILRKSITYLNPNISILNMKAVTSQEIYQAIISKNEIPTFNNCGRYQVNAALRHLSLSSISWTNNSERPSKLNPILNFEKIVALDLSNMSLVSFDFRWFPHLKILDLSNNLLTSFIIPNENTNVELMYLNIKNNPNLQYHSEALQDLTKFLTNAKHLKLFFDTNNQVLMDNFRIFMDLKLTITFKNRMASYENDSQDIEQTTNIEENSFDTSNESSLEKSRINYTHVPKYTNVGDDNGIDERSMGEIIQPILPQYFLDMNELNPPNIMEFIDSNDTDELELTLKAISFIIQKDDNGIITNIVPLFDPQDPRTNRFELVTTGYLNDVQKMKQIFKYFNKFKINENTRISNQMTSSLPWIPIFPQDDTFLQMYVLSSLDLSNCRIFDISQISTYCPNLISLNLRNNFIDDLSPLEYTTMKYLRHLNIMDQSPPLDFDQIKYCENLPKLKELRIQGNKDINPIKVFKYLRGLEYLDGYFNLIPLTPVENFALKSMPDFSRPDDPNKKCKWFNSNSISSIPISLNDIKNRPTNDWDDFPRPEELPEDDIPTNRRTYIRENSGLNTIEGCISLLPVEKVNIYQKDQQVTNDNIETVLRLCPQAKEIGNTTITDYHRMNAHKTGLKEVTHLNNLYTFIDKLRTVAQKLQYLMTFLSTSSFSKTSLDSIFMVLVILKLKISIIFDPLDIHLGITFRALELLFYTFIPFFTIWLNKVEITKEIFSLLTFNQYDDHHRRKNTHFYYFLMIVFGVFALIWVLYAIDYYYITKDNCHWDYVTLTLIWIIIVAIYLYIYFKEIRKGEIVSFRIFKEKLSIGLLQFFEFPMIDFFISMVDCSEAGFSEGYESFKCIGNPVSLLHIFSIIALLGLTLFICYFTYKEVTKSTKVITATIDSDFETYLSKLPAEDKEAVYLLYFQRINDFRTPSQSLYTEYTYPARYFAIYDLLYKLILSAFQLLTIDVGKGWIVFALSFIYLAVFFSTRPYQNKFSLIGNALCSIANVSIALENAISSIVILPEIVSLSLKYILGTALSFIGITIGAAGEMAWNCIFNYCCCKTKKNYQRNDSNRRNNTIGQPLLDDENIVPVSSTADYEQNMKLHDL